MCREIQREEQKAVRQVKEAAKRGDTASAKVLAREIVHTRKTISQLYMNKAHMISMNAQLSEQLGVAKVAGTLSKSTQVGPLNHPVMLCLPLLSPQAHPLPATSPLARCISSLVSCDRNHASLLVRPVH